MLNYSNFSLRSFNFSEFLILFSVIFNAFFCVLTGGGFAVTSSHVVIAQVFIFGLICLYGARYLHLNAIFVLVMIAFSFNLMVSFIYQSDVSFQNIYTVLVLPVSIFFIIYSKVDSWKIMKIIFAISLVVALLEIFIPNLLLNYFPVGQYYLNTRAWVADKGFQDDVGFYIGALRPGGSYIFTNVPRVGSIFLESLGYSYFLMAFILAVRVNVESRMKKILLISISLLLIMATDSRVGVVLGLFLVIVPLKFPKIYIPVFVYIVLVWIFAILLYNFYANGGLDVALRLGYTLEVLWDMSVAQMLGVEQVFGKFNDSGYLVYFSSVGIISFCLLLVWVDIIRYKRFVNKEIDLILPFIIVLSVTLFFGAAILSMKVIIIWVALTFSRYDHMADNRHLIKNAVAHQ